MVARQDIGGFPGGAGGGSSTGNGEVVRALQLDLAIFEDGLCAGPDTFGIFSEITAGIEKRREIAGQVLELQRSGASARAAIAARVISAEP